MIPGRTQRQCRTRWLQFSRKDTQASTPVPVEPTPEESHVEPKAPVQESVETSSDPKSPAESFFDDDSDAYDEDME